MESTPAKPQPGNWKAKGEDASILATSDEVAAGKAQLIDARPLSMAFGYTKRDYVYPESVGNLSPINCNHMIY